MHAHEVYDYAVVRIVPRVEREEFVNVGVILSCQLTGFLQAAIVLDEKRLLALDPHVDLETVHRHLGSIVAICEGRADGGPIAQLPMRSRYHWLTAKRSSIIQTSPSHMGMCTQPGEALARIMQRMVLPIPAEY
ncbi:DUF3037 domain-containing protein [Comamonas sp. Y33R10-2]|uniref:DUF3037 domain-containing protein n=1 Tax=Comamonas sp. Y33R10-2 TaxID=2853257 RepID=UPI001C5CA667|nr:DUF3037 domain-containing protein [Comamonas sp. Y33R10-2]QXZ10613.1 DUF3037 domain-containing protein [Comamonas sp. Y33R10-2]